jgi:mycothiol S-conjugate amidase
VISSVFVMPELDDRLCLMTIHAHPDDEASKGPGTVAKAKAEGMKTVLVCCTGGEQGEILNPAMKTPEVEENLHEVRMAELAESVRIIGYEELVFLGYRDSGMPETPANEDPRCFARAELDEAVGRLVATIREHRPHVIVTPTTSAGTRTPTTSGCTTSRCRPSRRPATPTPFRRRASRGSR